MILSKSINATSIIVHCAIFNDTEKITVLFLPMAMCITQDKRKVALNCFLSVVDWYPWLGFSPQSQDTVTNNVVVFIVRAL